MDFERSETTVELRTVNFTPTEPAAGWSASFDPQTGTASISYADVNGSSALRFPLAGLGGLEQLMAALASETPPAPAPDDEPPAEGE